MMPKCLVIGYLWCLLNWVTCYEISNLSFPNSFLFGAASSSYQVEGGWNEDGKAASNWDHIVHTSNVVVDGGTGDVASDSYHKYPEDIAALKELGANFYRFSLSWPRLLPNGFTNEVNQAGVEYYDNLINGLLAEGIEPWVTIYHWDLPQIIDYLGGWNNGEIVGYFTDLADLAFQLFGDRVKTWITINEPMMFCAGFPNGVLKTPVVPLGITEYLCGHNAIRAHGKIYRLYQLKYKASQRGRITITLNIDYAEPGSSSPADVEAAHRKMEFDLGWYLNPIVYGDYPRSMIDSIRNYSAIQGYPSSRLPMFTLAEKLEIKGSYDFLAINHYTSVVVYDNRSQVATASFNTDDGTTESKDSSWKVSAARWLVVHPEGFRKMLVYIKENYGNPEIAITEQGYADVPNTLNDTDRINYYQLYLSAALRAIHEDGVKLTAYTAWSLLDSFEWSSGYTVSFGLHHVDFGDPNRPRTPKESAKYYKKVIATRCLVDSCV